MDTLILSSMQIGLKVDKANVLKNVGFTQQRGTIKAGGT
jgi:hypothetical protein